MNPHDVARYLQDNPDFFNTHAELFTTLQVPHPHEGRAIPLAERQVMALRERLRALELRTADLVRNARENEVIADRLWAWTRLMLCERELADLPETLRRGLAELFSVPDVALRVWGADPVHTRNSLGELAPWAEPVSESVLLFAKSMMAPYCGPNSGFEAVDWLDHEARSVVLVPLRVGASPNAFGLLVLGSPDPDRYSVNMGTAFLARIAELASAALSRLLPPSGRV
jgi:uncharacterized protein YigA (DUF484 family)